MAPLSSEPRVHKWAGSTTGWVLMWNGDSGADTWCLAMEPMSQSCFIIIWQLLAPFTSQPRVHKWAGSTTGWVLMWNGDSGADTWCPAMEPMCQIMFYNHLAPLSSQPRVHKWAGSTTGWVLMWNGDSGADTWCPAMEPMCQIMFYNHLAIIVKSAKGPQVGRFHNWMGPDVERGQFCGHLVSGHRTNVSNYGTNVMLAVGPQVGWFHNGMGPVVVRGQWCGHLVSSHGTKLSDHVL